MALQFVQGPPWPETDEQRRARVAREAALIAEARAELDAGPGIEGEELDAWLERLEQDPDAAPPIPQRGAASKLRSSGSS